MNETYTWTELKELQASKGVPLQYKDMNNDYVIWFVEGGFTYTAYIQKTSPAGTDQSDFETNYKDDANKPVNIGEDCVIDALAIRDTSAHSSLVSDNRGAIPKTIVIYNNTNQSVSVQLQGDRDEEFDGPMNMGSPFTIASSTHDYATISDYLPYLRVMVTATSSPSSGTLSAYILRVMA
jgi:hypothetical protein